MVELLFGIRNSRKNEPSERCRSKQSSEEAVEAMPKTIERTLSGSEMAPPFHRTRRISLNYCAAYFFRKDGVCVALAYFFPGRVRRLFLPGTLQVRSKHVNDTVRYGNFFLTPTVRSVQLRLTYYIIREVLYRARDFIMSQDQKKHEFNLGPRMLRLI